MQLDRAAARRAFDAYVQNYDVTLPKVQLKIAHTYRVAALCERIAQSATLPPADVDLAWLSGLLHDVGRFEQLRRFGTFVDADSIDHAACSVEVLFDEGRIRDYTADASEDALLRTVVALHNAYRLPDTLDARTLRFCTILRDADKIDILRANCDFPLEEIYNCTHAQLYTSAITPAVYENFCQEHTIPRQVKRTPADNVISLVSLVYELVWPQSVQLVQEQGYLERLLQFSSQNPETAATFADAAARMHRWLAAHSS